jgi:nicotinamide mononucleotide transporter
MTSPAEWVAATTGLLCAWLTVKNRISNWPWGIVSVLIYGWIFWQNKLYANAGLQILYFLPCCVYGWWVWAKCGPTHNDDLPVRNLAPARWAVAVGVTAALSLLIGLLMDRYTNDPRPYADGLITGMSIVAQWLQAKKLYENWWLWIGVDVVSVFYLYPLQGLWVTAALYVVFLVIAIRGAIEWRQLLANQGTEPFTARGLEVKESTAGGVP